MNLGYMIPFLLVISPVVFIHEFGHFIVARWCGVVVETFSIGFGRSIASWRDKKGTVWKIGWLPLGGYVKFAGDEGPASNPDRATMQLLSAGGGSIDPEAVKGYFHFKPLPQRAAIVAAGPIANFLFAILIFAAIYVTVGEQRVPARLDVKEGSSAAQAGFQTGDRVLAVDGRDIQSFGQLDEIVSMSGGQPLDIVLDRAGATLTLRATPDSRAVTDRFHNSYKMGEFTGLSTFFPARVDEVNPNTAAAEAGFKPGDVIRLIDGKPVQTFGQMQEIVSASAGRPLRIVAARDGQLLTLIAIPRAHEVADQAGKHSMIGLLGLTCGGDVTYKRYDPFTAVWKGADRTAFVIEKTLDFVGGMIMGRQDGSQLSGPLGMAKMAGDLAQLGFGALVSLAAMLSISIGLINLFPIPMLDGGHLLYYAYEAARGRPLGVRAQELGFRIGLAFVISVMVFATWNDLVKFQIFGG